MINSVRHVVLAIAVVAACTTAISACGGDSSSQTSAAKELVEQTFKTTSTSLESGRLDARLQLEPEGLLALGGPIAVAVKGPVVSPKGDGLPQANLDAVVTLAGQRYEGGLLSDGAQAFLMADGRAYTLDHERSPKRPELLGLDPLSWIKDEQTKGNARIGGVDTVRVTGAVDAARLLADVDDLVPAKMGAQIARAVKSATFELWTGAEDKILRQFVLRVAFEVAEGDEPPVTGLQAGRIELRIRLDDVNGAAPEIRAPANPLPLSKLPKDSGLGGLIECLSKGGTSGTGLVQCVATLQA